VSGTRLRVLAVTRFVAPAAASGMACPVFAAQAALRIGTLICSGLKNPGQLSAMSQASPGI